MGVIEKITDKGQTAHLIASTAYGTCDTAADIADKVAIIQDNHSFTLETGVTVHIKFKYYNNASNPTLNVNSTGAKSLRHHGTTSVGKSIQGSWVNDAVVALTYDGTNWVLNNSNDSIIASSQYAHAEGQGTTASGENAHSEGRGTTASGENAHSEGNWTTASGISSHSEGYSTTSSGYGSHSEGSSTTASKEGAHSEGINTIASGQSSHSEGYYTTANHRSQHVFGEYNILDTSTATATKKGNYVEIVGNGTADDARSNARTLDWDGNEVLAGSVTAAGGFIGNVTGAVNTMIEFTISGSSASLNTQRTVSDIISSYLSGENILFVYDESPVMKHIYKVSDIIYLNGSFSIIHTDFLNIGGTNVLSNTTVIFQSNGSGSVTVFNCNAT